MTNQSPASVKRLPNSDSAIKTDHILNTPSPLLKHNQTIPNAPDTPVQSPSTSRIGKQGNRQTSSTDLRLGMF